MAETEDAPDTRAAGGDWDHESHEEFYAYYAQESASPRTRERFVAIRDMVLRVATGLELDRERLCVADVGCGAGAQSLIWAEAGHDVHGLDVNAPLVELARRRAREAGLNVEFEVGSADDLPWADASMDACIAPELLEHVAPWAACLDEFARILRPGGILVVTTTNSLCPKQQEFNLPLYSWYPGPIKRRYERLAVTTRPEIANYAKYPAVNWFTFYGLRREFRRRGLRSLDRFDVMDLTGRGATARGVVGAVRALPPLRWLAHVATPYTLVVGIKDDSPTN